MKEWTLMRAAETPRVGGPAGVTRVYFTRDEIGSEQLMTGITSFESGKGLFWHVHTVDESITILEGEPTVEVGGAGRPIQSAQMKPYDTVYVPAYTPHRFINRTDRPASILWSYPTGRIARYRVNPDGSRPDDLAPGELEVPNAR